MPENHRRLKPRWLFLLAGLAAGVLAVICWPRPIGGPETVNVRFLSVSNDASGGRWAAFSATNGTRRLFVRGRSELEMKDGSSNVVGLVQIRSVDYLRPEQCIVFSVACPAPGHAWRLRFIYLGQRSHLEDLQEALAWAFHNLGLRVSEKRLRLTPVREITTEWIN